MVSLATSRGQNPHDHTSDGATPIKWCYHPFACVGATTSERAGFGGLGEESAERHGYRRAQRHRADDASRRPHRGGGVPAIKLTVPELSLSSIASPATGIQNVHRPAPAAGP